MLQNRFQLLLYMYELCIYTFYFIVIVSRKYRKYSLSCSYSFISENKLKWFFFQMTDDLKITFSFLLQSDLIKHRSTLCINKINLIIKMYLYIYNNKYKCIIYNNKISHLLIYYRERKRVKDTIIIKLSNASTAHRANKIHII